MLNGLGFDDDVPNNEDEAKVGFVLENKDDEVVGNKEPPDCPNSVVLGDDVNRFELAADALLNEVPNVLLEPKPVEVLGANGLFCGVDENGFGLT